MEKHNFKKIELFCKKINDYLKKDLYKGKFKKVKTKNINDYSNVIFNENNNSIQLLNDDNNDIGRFSLENFSFILYYEEPDFDYLNSIFFLLKKQPFLSNEDKITWFSFKSFIIKEIEKQKH